MASRRPKSWWGCLGSTLMSDLGRPATSAALPVTGGRVRPITATQSAPDGFPQAARRALADTQLRGNLRAATHTIREKRLRAVSEVEDWEQLREAGRRIKHHAIRHLERHLVRLE